MGAAATTAEQIASYIHPDDFAPAFRSWEYSLATQQPLELECRIRDHTGAYRWMLGRALPSRNEQGEVMQWIGTYTDIHEHKLAQQRVAQAQRLLRDNNEELTRVNVDLDSFIYTASHDLKGPITNIEGLLQALTDELPIEARQRPPVQNILGMLTKSVERFQRTIEQLSDVAKLQREHGLASTPVPLTSVIQGVILDLAPLIRATEAELGCRPGRRPGGALPRKKTCVAWCTTCSATPSNTMTPSARPACNCAPSPRAATCASPWPTTAWASTRPASASSSASSSACTATSRAAASACLW